ncbi:MAG: endopeptidase La [Bacteroidetes bacterium]|nr:MAG: endopeptidase La [Bacteroidota bacterium]PIE87859.1 MAG: endopeptidase La [Bacteroidota bacterium]
MNNKDLDFYQFEEDINEEQEQDMIPLLALEDEENTPLENLPEQLPVLPLRNTVLFPGVVIPITVGRDKSLKLIKDANDKEESHIAVVAQKDVEVENPKMSDLNRVGTVARILKILHMSDDSQTVIIQGRTRFVLDKIVAEEPYMIAEVLPFGSAKETAPSEDFSAVIATIKDMAIQVIEKSPNIPNETAFAIRNIDSPPFIVNFIASNLDIEVHKKQELLEIVELGERASAVMNLLNKELQTLEVRNQIRSKVKSDLDRQQREFILNQQLKTIQEELGDQPLLQDVDELKEKAKSKKWNEEVKEVFDKEMRKLQRMNPAAVEYSIQKNYLDVLVELPWGEYTTEDFELADAQRILDEDHYGLEKVKERIIEYLAVLKLKGDMKSPILCLVGPPGVGKTSLGKSIARAIGRKYVRMSLGGLRDEAEIRGHRKTYIGAMPGRIIQNLRKVKYSNPVFVLDEVDKVSGASLNGDPSAALLEVLDPEQNDTFHDNFLEVEYDLSRIMFVATANNLNSVHPALRDRMEIIDISGYLMEEKVEIAKRHLIPKQLKEHGITRKDLTLSKSVIERIIQDYTRESGVRLLDKKIATVIRNRVKYIALGESYNKRLTLADLKTILGKPRFHHDRSLAKDAVGVVTGLAWTQVGGEILFVESSLSNGKGNLTLTGNLGEVMKESATLAFKYLKAHADELKINPEEMEAKNVHIHIPEGATPKDGPSAGIAMFTALTSAFTHKPVKKNVAMTGEITLRGQVLPVGGIKEKILAAKRAAITDIILSESNKKDIEEIPERYLKGITFHYIDKMIEVMDLAF